MEALRHKPIIPGVMRKASAKATIRDGDKQIKVDTGDYVFSSFVHAGQDQRVFNEPQNININRDPQSYSLLTKGLKMSSELVGLGVTRNAQRSR